MNTDDLNFAYKVRHALNEKLDDLPSSTTDRLANARKMALARKKAHVPVLVLQTARADGRFSSLFSGPSPWLKMATLAVPMLALVFGMAGIYHVEEKQRITELAEMDAAVLSDELPLSAYLDHGFNAYLNTKREQ